MTNPTDEELISATLAGEQRAFADLVRRYERRVAVTIQSVMGSLSQEDLADIAQDVFLLVFRSLASFRGESGFGTYIIRITLRHCYRESKRRRRRRGIFQSLNVGDANERPLEERIAGGVPTDRPLVAEERRREVMDALAQLPEEFRTVLVLRVVEELSVEQVAAALDISPGTVKSRLYRAREKMRDLLAGLGLEFRMDSID